MSDQVALLPTLTPPIRQIGYPGAPCGGRSCCTDCVGVEIVRRERGRAITPAQFRRAARPGDTTPCAGLTPAQFLRGLRAFGVKGYEYHANVTAGDVLEATDRGIVLVGVGYAGYPIPSECQVGGKHDLGFRGAHAISVWGRRKRDGRWVVWTRDPDHRYGGKGEPPYDRFDMRYLSRAIAALVGADGGNGSRWTNTFAIWRPE
jgi:hypothetical protein